MTSICGTDIKEYTVKSVWKTEKTDIFCKKYGLSESEQTNGKQIVLDNSSLRYDAYGVTITPDKVHVWGSYRSFAKAFEKLMNMLDSIKDLTEKHSFKDTIKLPKPPYKNKEELLSILKYLQNDKRILFGQHLAGSLSVADTIQDYTVTVGQGPTIIDFDMCGLRKHSRAEWSKAICELVEYSAKGGVITTMHHWLNPAYPESDSYRGNIGGVEGWKKVLTRGTDINLNWHEELDRGADFLGALRDAGVSVMFRPLHEANGTWFWFCAGQGEKYGWIPSELMIEMWKYVYHYYVDEKGLTNLLWNYGPNVSDGVNMPSVKYYYPGPEYCDVVGFDWYTGGYYEFDGETYDSKCYDRLIEYGQPFGFMEWGIGGELRADSAEDQINVFNCAGYVKILERFFSEGRNLAFAEVYSGPFGAPSYLGNGKALKDCGFILGLEEMPELIKSIVG